MYKLSLASGWQTFSRHQRSSSWKMWLKLFFLLLYFMVLFMLARIFEAVVWYETGVFATQLVDPVSLSYKKLKTILECRGLGYSGLPEKKDVSELVEKSGRDQVLFTLMCCFCAFTPSETSGRMYTTLLGTLVLSNVIQYKRSAINSACWHSQRIIHLPTCLYWGWSLQWWWTCMFDIKCCF